LTKPRSRPPARRAAAAKPGRRLLDLSASQALRDAFVEFDPEIRGIEDLHGPRTAIPHGHEARTERVITESGG